MKKVIVFSSGNVYRLNAFPVSEEAPIYPTALAPYYLISKACADFYADVMSRNSGIDVVTLRPPGVYGPGLIRGMIPTFIKKLEAGDRLVITNGGRFRSDLVYVEDVAKATACSLRLPVQGVFNLGSGNTYSSLQIAQLIARLLGSSPNLLHVQAGEEKQLGFSPLDIRKAKSVLEFHPRDIQQGLLEYVNWWRTNK